MTSHIDQATSPDVHTTRLVQVEVQRVEQWCDFLPTNIRLEVIVAPSHHRSYTQQVLLYIHEGNLEVRLFNYSGRVILTCPGGDGVLGKQLTGR